jgi:hypothetical protein
VGDILTHSGTEKQANPEGVALESENGSNRAGETTEVKIFSAILILHN